MDFGTPPHFWGVKIPPPKPPFLTIFDHFCTGTGLIAPSPPHPPPPPPSPATPHPPSPPPPRHTNFVKSLNFLKKSLLSVVSFHCVQRCEFYRLHVAMGFITRPAQLRPAVLACSCALASIQEYSKQTNNVKTCKI